MKKGRGVQRIEPVIEPPAIDDSELLSIDNDTLSLEQLSEAYARLLEATAMPPRRSRPISASLWPTTVLLH